MPKPNPIYVPVAGALAFTADGWRLVELPPGWESLLADSEAIPDRPSAVPEDPAPSWLAQLERERYAPVPKDPPRSMNLAGPSAAFGGGR